MRRSRTAINSLNSTGSAVIPLKVRSYSRLMSRTTVSEMELCAAVEALRLTPTGAQIEVRSDSELLIDGMRFLVFRWQRFGWRNSRGFELQHQELWSELLKLNERRTIRWRWIRGHNGHPVQTRADALACQTARTQWCSLHMA